MKDKNDGHILGSLRFNYMIPVPDHLLYKLDINALPTVNNRIHTSKELAFCRRNRDRIYRIALKTYNRVISKTDDTLLKNSCDFAVLEQAYSDYKCQHNYQQKMQSRLFRRYNSAYCPRTQLIQAPPDVWSGGAFQSI